MKKINVPLLKQGKNECGPTALIMVLKYFDRDISKRKMIDEIEFVNEKNVEMIKLAKFSRRMDFDVVCYSYNKKFSKGEAEIKKPKKLDILKFLDECIPVILAVRTYVLFNEDPSEVGHFIVIVGHDNQKFIYNDTYDRKLKKINQGKLMKALEENALDSSWYLLAIKPKLRN